MPAWLSGVRTLFPKEAVEVMERDARKMRGERPFVFSNQKVGQGLEEIIAFIEKQGMLSAA